MDKEELAQRSHFGEEVLDGFKRLDSLDMGSLFSRIIYDLYPLCLLDLLAKMHQQIFKSKEKNQCKIFVALLQNCPSWSGWHKISTPTLIEGLHDTGAPTVLKRSLDGYINQWPESLIPNITDMDLTIEEMKLKFPDEAPEIDKYQHEIERYSLASMLYAYRNARVHTLMAPGIGDFRLDRDEPYYMQFGQDIAGERVSWKLNFPQKFIRQTAENCVLFVLRLAHDQDINLDDTFHNLKDLTLGANWGISKRPWKPNQ